MTNEHTQANDWRERLSLFWMTEYGKYPPLPALENLIAQLLAERDAETEARVQLEIQSGLAEVGGEEGTLLIVVPEYPVGGQRQSTHGGL